jgi:hypothetical protein
MQPQRRLIDSVLEIMPGKMELNGLLYYVTMETLAAGVVNGHIAHNIKEGYYEEKTM